MAGALSGLRVIDFGQYIAGPLAAMLLADQGADVIHVDPPGGPRWNVAANALWNRGKRGIGLDLKAPQDIEIARRLIASADIVIENFRPGVMTRLGLDSEALCRLHPHLIWCALPGFAADDPRAALPAWEGVLGAATGNFMLKVEAERVDAGRQLPRLNEDRPIYTTTPLSSMFGACLGAVSIAMALIARQRDGHGQRIEVPLYDATFAAIGMPHWVGKPGTPWTRSYECADGRWIDIIGFHAKFILAFLKEAGVEHWLQEDFAGDIRRPFKTTPEQATALLAKLEALFRTRAALDWETALNAAGVPVAVCRTTAEWLTTDQARQSGAIVEWEDPLLGRILLPGMLVNLSACPGVLSRPAPLPDQHRMELLAELETLPLRAPAPFKPRDQRPPLAGLRVIDLGTVLVGPTCGRTLAEFGADVIKIDNPAGQGPDPDVSRGKRSMLLDLSKPAGLDVMLRLADTADVFLQNFRLGVAEKLGFGYPQLRLRSPGLIYVSFNLYGRVGPWAYRPGFENQAQAATGMQERFGGGCPAKEPLPVNDYGTSLLGSFGVALALYHKNRTGGGAGQLVDTALTFSASLMQSPLFIGGPNHLAQAPRGQNALGSGPLHRAYQVMDGWIFLGARAGQVDDLEGVNGLAGISEVPARQLALFLEQRLRAGTASEWTARLAQAGIGVHELATIPKVMALPYVRARELYLERAHPDGGMVATIGAIARLSSTPLQHGRPLRSSMDALEILGEIGLQERSGDYLAQGVIAIRPPRRKKSA